MCNWLSDQKCFWNFQFTFSFLYTLSQNTFCLKVSTYSLFIHNNILFSFLFVSNLGETDAHINLNKQSILQTTILSFLHNAKRIKINLSCLLLFLGKKCTYLCLTLDSAFSRFRQHFGQIYTSTTTWHLFIFSDKNHIS